MAQVIVTIDKVNVFEDEKGCNCNLVFNQKIHGYKRVVDENGNVDFLESDEVTYISLPRKALVAQLKALDDNIAMYFNVNQEITRKELNIALFKATLTIERTNHVAGEVYGTAEDGTDLAFARDCITSEIVDIKLSKFAIDKMEASLL